jgi:hypothetical protein
MLSNGGGFVLFSSILLLMGCLGFKFISTILKAGLLLIIKIGYVGIFSDLLIHHPKDIWRNACFLFKQTGEMLRIFKAQFVGNFTC